MAGLSSLLDISRKGLFASQSWIETIGNNISNVNTPGYHRRTVNLVEDMSLDWRPGQLGTGVKAQEVVRHFDSFVEASYNDKSSMSRRYESLFENLRGVDALFNEANGGGMSEALNKFFSDWQDLTLRPDSDATREALMSDTWNLMSVFQQTDEQLTRMQEQVDDFIRQDVDSVNDMLRSIADLNRQINIQEVPGANNANQLRDQRDALVRQLAEKIDIKTLDNGGGNYTITTHAGQTLVDGQEHYDISFEGPKSYAMLTTGSPYAGNVNFAGHDDYEYTIQVSNGGTVGAAGTTCRISLDGGQTWLVNDDGTQNFAMNPESGKIEVRGVSLWFDAGDVATGDTFVVVPKSGLYWHQTTATSENITPQVFFSGQDNARRVTGGTLAGLFDFRDDAIGSYRDRLDSLARSLIWEVNAIHSQGAGQTPFTSEIGTFTVADATVALGSESSGLDFQSRLTAGNAGLNVYDTTTGERVAFGPLDFTGTASGIANFDPSVHSLNDVVQAINDTYGSYLTASVDNGALRIDANSGYSFQFDNDTAGLYAALGVNTFFDGDSAASISVNPNVGKDISKINAGHVNGAGESNAGDNTTASRLAQLSGKKVTITTVDGRVANQTILEFYNSLVANVGADTDNAEFNHAYQKAMADDLDKRQQEVSGVNLDEEMSNLIKYQHAYTAAAKMISTADQMLQTLLALKQ